MKVSFNKATDTDLQICAIHVGFKGDERLVQDRTPLSREDRNALIRCIQQAGYRSIDITDTDNIVPSRVPKH